MKIIIASPDYTFKHGGIIALHKLSDILNQIGYDSYLINSNSMHQTIQLNPNYNTKSIRMDDIDTDMDIIVYPEIIRGNPYNVKHCVRYILYFNDKRGDIYNSWGNSDYWLYYRKGFYDGRKENNFLQIIDSGVSYFTDRGDVRQKNSCYNLRKAGYYEHISKLYHTHSSTCIDNIITNDGYLNVFNEFKKYYNYDADSYTSVIARLCGCESIIVPLQGVSEKEYYKNRELQRMATKYGDDGEMVYTLEELREYLLKEEQQQVLNTVVMFDKIVKYFKSDGIVE